MLYPDDHLHFAALENVLEQGIVLLLSAKAANLVVDVWTKKSLVLREQVFSALAAGCKAIDTRLIGLVELLPVFSLDAA